VSQTLTRAWAAVAALFFRSGVSSRGPVSEQLKIDYSKCQSSPGWGVVDASVPTAGSTVLSSCAFATSAS
jgi:hypothetical protein